MTPEPRNTIDDATHEEWVAASRNMKMEISKEWAEQSAKIEGDAAVGAGLPSALGLPKLAAQPSALDLATGSLPVSSAEAFYRNLLEQICEDKRLTRARRIAESGLIFWDQMQKEKNRRQMEATIQRQPEENSKDEPRRY